MTTTSDSRPANSARQFATAALALAAIFAVSVAAAQDPAAPEIPRDAERAIAFNVGGISLALPLPSYVRVFDDGTGGRLAVDATRGGRLERWLEIAAAPGAAPPAGGRSRQLPGGAELTYEINDDTGGGSGGPVAALTGTLTIDGHAFSVTCTDQDELGREPDWCLPYLGRMAIVGSEP